jgi:hypothetical protein
MEYLLRRFFTVRLLVESFTDDFADFAVRAPVTQNLAVTKTETEVQ